MKPCEMTIAKFHESLTSREFSAIEALKETYRQIDAKNKEIGAYLSLAKNGAERAAEAVDERIARGERVSLMSGVPVGIKDNLLLEGEPCTAGSKILEGYVAAYDATAVAKLKAEGAVMVGKTNMDEFGMGSSTENSAFGKTRNPRDVSKVPGGSSGGSAAAVAANMAIAALGSDTGGSIRQPADFCGVVGLKPTYGAVSRYGLIPLASSLDTVGIEAKTVDDAAILFGAISGKDPHDATSVEKTYGKELYESHPERIRAMTIGLPKEYFGTGISKEIGERMEGVIAAFKGMDIRFKEVSLPHTSSALSVYYIIMPAEASANLARFDGIRYGKGGEGSADIGKRYVAARSRGFGEEAKRRIMLGTYVLSSGYYDAYYAKAQKVRTLIANDFKAAFEEVDALLTPVSPTLPFAFGEKTNDPLAMYLSDIFTITANLAGVPALVVPPGFQLIGKPFHEHDLLGLGREYERKMAS